MIVCDVLRSFLLVCIIDELLSELLNDVFYCIKWLGIEVVFDFMVVNNVVCIVEFVIFDWIGKWIWVLLDVMLCNGVFLVESSVLIKIL